MSSIVSSSYSTTNRWLTASPFRPSAKREKCRIEIESFSGLKVQVVQQDCYAKIFMLNLPEILSQVA